MDKRLSNTGENWSIGVAWRMQGQIEAWLALAGQRGASDLHLTAESPPVLRIDGCLVPIEGVPPLRPAEVAEVLDPLLSDRFRAVLQERGECDFAYSLAGVGRFRVNIYRQRGSLAGALRLIPFGVPSLESLELPAMVAAFAEETQGLVVVTGPTGSGKSTTLAALVDQINNRRSVHVITLEDPIEYLHRHRHSLVNQREVGIDCLSFAEGLRAALREDPDVIMIGEMRDLETIETALTAAETGHLVLATLHTPSAALTIDRIVGSFPAAQQNQVRLQLSGVLRGIVAQRLVPRRNGHGRVAVCEVLVGTPAVANLVREGKTAQVVQMMESGGTYGMSTLAISATELLTRGVIGPDSLHLLGVRNGAVNGRGSYAR